METVSYPRCACAPPELNEWEKVLVNFTRIGRSKIKNNQLTRNIICGKTFYSKLDEKSLKYEALYITKTTSLQREYYNHICLEKAKEDLFSIW